MDNVQFRIPTNMNPLHTHGFPKKKSCDLSVKSVKQCEQRIHVALVVLRMDTGGTERYIANIASHLDRKNFRVSIICLDRSGPASDWIDREDVEVVELHLKTDSLKAIKTLAAALRSLKPDIVHSHNWGTLLESYLAVRRVGSIVHLHGERGSVLGTNACGPVKRKLRAAVMRWICRRIVVTTNSYCVAEKVCSITGIEPAEIHVVPNGLDPKYTLTEMKKLRKTVRQELGFQDNDLVIGTVARLSKVKNLGLAIRALATLRGPRKQQAHLLLVGDGPSRQELETLATSEGVSRFVHFVGHQSDTWRFLAAMDVFVNCSDSEGMSQSMLEAMAAGLPIVATDVGDAAIMVGPPEPCGIVIAPNEISELSQSMAAILDSDQQETYAAAALNRQQTRYSLASMLRGYEDLYHELVVSSS